MTQTYRHTKIIATLGPATESKEMLAKLIRGGVDILRLNMAHASPQWVTDSVRNIREVSAQVGRHAAVMMDVKGPEIRTGAIEEPISLEPDDLLEFHIEGATPTGDVPAVPINYAGLPGALSVGTTVLVDSGLIQLAVVDKSDTHIRLKALGPAELGSRRPINLPGTQVDLPALTEKDRDDLRAGVQAGVDFVALSFVRAADDVRVLRDYLDGLGSKARIIAKIEDQTGVRNMDEIVRAADAVMVARGDLGIEVDYHRLPLIQTQLIKACQAEGKPVIVATHMLDSMIHSPIPTRAEVSDVSHAIREQADAVMLSGETTIGAYPTESVQAFRDIIESS